MGEGGSSGGGRRFGGSESGREPVREEIDLYLELRAEEFEEQGLDPDEARKAALQAFGDPERIAEECVRLGPAERVRGWVTKAVAALWQDVHFSVRTSRRNAGFTAMALGTLAIGIGATTAIVSVTDAVLLRQPSVRAPDRLVAVYTTCRRGAPRCSSSYPDYLDYRSRSATLEDLAAFTFRQVNLADETGARLVFAKPVTGNFFQLLGVAPAVGRTIVPSDDRLEAPARAVVLGHDFWTREFGADPDVVGREVRLNGSAFEVVGVAAAEYRGLMLDDNPALWFPMSAIPLVDPEFGDRLDVRGSRWISNLIGRMAPHAAVEQVRAEMASISNQLADEDPDARGPRSITVDAMGTYMLPVSDQEGIVRFVWLLTAVVGFALLMTCVNLANLLLARSGGRRREMGIRLALGAGRRRLARQLLTESLVLAVTGGLLGLLVAGGMLRLLGGFELPGGVPVAALGIEMDGRMFALMLLLSAATGLLFGWLPASRATRANLAGWMKGDAGEGWSAERLRGGMVAAQVSLCFVLLTGSGLFLRSLGEALETDAGFRPESLALARFDLSLNRYTPEQASAFVDELTRSVREFPGVSSATLGQRVPLQQAGGRGLFAGVEGYEPAQDEEIRIDLNMVSPGHLVTLGRTVVRGRDFREADDEAAPPVAIVNETMARRYWPGGSAVGGRISLGAGNRFSDDAAVFTVVGVVADTKWRALDETATSFVSLSYRQRPQELAERALTLAIRVSGPPSPVLGHVRSQARALDPSVSMVELSTGEQSLARVLMPQRMGALLLSCFAVLALTLAAVGIFGVVGYVASRRTREVGIRMALGAQRTKVLALMAQVMLVPVMAGLVAGMVAASLLARSVEGFMFGIEARDPLTFGAIAVVLALVAALATLVPASRASRVSPVEALRAE